jgi:hypothetical protein
MAAVRNVIILKGWEIVSPGGCVKEQMVGPLSKMTAVRNVIFKKGGK